MNLDLMLAARAARRHHRTSWGRPGCVHRAQHATIVTTPTRTTR
jgi:hypothetical protein